MPKYEIWAGPDEVSMVPADCKDKKTEGLNLVHKFDAPDHQTAIDKCGRWCKEQRSQMELFDK